MWSSFRENRTHVWAEAKTAADRPGHRPAPRGPAANPGCRGRQDIGATGGGHGGRRHAAGPAGSGARRGSVGAGPRADAGNLAGAGPAKMETGYHAVAPEATAGRWAWTLSITPSGERCSSWAAPACPTR